MPKRKDPCPRHDYDLPQAPCICGMPDDLPPGRYSATVEQMTPQARRRSWTSPVVVPLRTILISPDGTLEVEDWTTSESRMLEVWYEQRAKRRDFIQLTLIGLIDQEWIALLSVVATLSGYKQVR